MSNKYSCSHNTTSKYAVLQETNETEMETWLYFLRYDGNEENLTHLKTQLDSFETHIIENCSSIDIDIDHLVSAQTAKEMTKVELNSQWHRKFDGTLKRIDLNFKKKHDNEDRIVKTYEVLGLGQISEYISDEDIDDEDIDHDVEKDNDTSDDEGGDDDSSEDASSEDDSSEDASSEDGEEEEKEEKIESKLPSLLV